MYKIIEGAITIGFGIIAWFFLPNFPDQNTFLTREETRLVLQRVEHDRGDSVPDVVTKEKLLSHLLDWKVWTFGMTLICSDWIYILNYPFPALSKVLCTCVQPCLLIVSGILLPIIIIISLGAEFTWTTVFLSR